MFLVNRLNKLVFGDASKESIIEVPEGQLYVVRPLSPKGYSELIYKDASISVRRTSSEYQYQLVVTRVFEEGEEELLAEEEGGEESPQNQFEQSFLLDEALQFRVTIRDTGEKVFAWRDLEGSTGDLWEFVCDYQTKSELAEAFQVAAFKCQFERRFKKPAEHATEDELAQFSFIDEPVPSASPLLESSRSSGISPSPTSVQIKSQGVTTASAETAIMAPPKSKAIQAAVPEINTKGRDQLCREKGELHFYDIESRNFVLKEDPVELVVFDLGNFAYWLKVESNSGTLVGRTVTADLSPVFNFEYLSFIFNVFDESGSVAHSWLLRVKDQPTLDRVQQGAMQALWENENRVKWTKNTEAEQEYILETLNDLELTDAPAEEEEPEDEDDDESETGLRAEHYDSDESDEDTDPRGRDANINSLLAVGAKHDRSFVVRGSKIGVFKHNADNQLEFSTNISKVETPKGRLFSPKKVMLHAGDRNMILQDPTNANSVYRMDLETGKVVDEWKVHDDISINTFAPEQKFDQLTDKQTFLGLSNNAMYRVDPRLSGNKLVDTDMKQYATKGINFTSAATTANGYLAVGNEKGDVRLFDTLGKMAKTALPALGGEIIGLDVSADGRYVLATCKTYILLVDSMQKEGKWEGKLGFEKAFPADRKPTPYRLSLTPPHIAEFQHSTGKPISFTPARFNAGPDNKETTIITATGPFIITWSLKKVLEKRKDPYSIKRYSEDVKADNFRFGSDKGIIVALPNEVDMVRRAQLKKVTRESLAAPRMSTGSRGSGYLRRSDVVREAY